MEQLKKLEQFFRAVSALNEKQVAYMTGFIAGAKTLIGTKTNNKEKKQ